MRAHCPVCMDPLDQFTTAVGLPSLDAEPLISHVNGIVVHSGHCEAEALKQRRARITGFPMPADLVRRYGA